MSRRRVFYRLRGDSFVFQLAVAGDLRAFRDEVETIEAFPVTKHERPKVAADQLTNGRVLTGHGRGDESVHAFREVGSDSRHIGNVTAIGKDVQVYLAEPLLCGTV